MFEVKFLNPPFDDLTEYETEGRILAGELDEMFLAPIGCWNEEDYLASCIKELTRLVGGSEVAVLLAHADDVRKNTCARGFVCYRCRSDVRVQESIFDSSNNEGDLDLLHPTSLAHDYQARSEDGLEISEWQVPVGDVEHFLVSSTKRRDP